MPQGYSLNGNVIIINRDLTKLDMFVKDFLDVFRKHSDYLIVNGFVSISTGRTRGTEDVDILTPVMDEKNFSALFNELVKRDFWCYQGDNYYEAYSYFKDMVSIRFARKGEVFRNMECIPIHKSKPLQFFEFSNPQTMHIGSFEFKIPPLEFEILYKEIILGSEKDIADAKHLRTIFSTLVKEENFKRFEKIIRGNYEKANKQS